MITISKQCGDYSKEERDAHGNQQIGSEGYPKAEPKAVNVWLGHQPLNAQNDDDLDHHLSKHF